MSDVMSEQKRRIGVTINGAKHDVEVPVRLTLADFLRHQMMMTGTHVGCEHGVCGACTVLVDGRAVRSCLMLAVQANDRAITTVEGLAPDSDSLHPLQEAFRDHHALQCGFCTSGILSTLQEVLADNPDPSRDEMRLALSGNICRCTGYQSIIEAALDGARRLRERQEP